MEEVLEDSEFPASFCSSFQPPYQSPRPHNLGCLHRQMVRPLDLERSLERSWAHCTADIRHIQVPWDIHTSADRPGTSVHCFDTIDCRLGNPALAHCLGNRVVVHCLGIDSPRHGSSKEWEHDRGHRRKWVAILPSCHCTMMSLRRMMCRCRMMKSRNQMRDSTHQHNDDQSRS